MQAVKKCYDANELSYKKEKDGTELWGMHKKAHKPIPGKYRTSVGHAPR